MKNRISKVLLAVLIVTVASGMVYSQWRGRARLGGNIIDQDGNPLADVKLKLFCYRASGGFETTTDEKGHFKAYWVRGGKWDLDFNKTGYEPMKRSAHLTEDGKLQFMENLVMKKIEGLVLTKDMMKILDQGNQLYSAKQYQPAIEVFQSILADFPDAYIVNLNIGNCFFELKQYDQAIESYKKVLEKNDKHISALQMIGNSYSEKNDAAKALEWYGKIEFEKLEDPVILYNIGTFYFNANQSTEAIKFLKRSVETQEGNVDAMYWLGMAYMGLGKNKEAVAIYEEYLKFDSESDRSNQVKEIIKALKGGLPGA